MEEVGEEFMDLKTLRDSTRIPIESTNLDSPGLPETEQQTKEHTYAGPRSPVYM